jgi:hypothetical protein
MYAQLRADVQRSLGLHQAPSESASEVGQAAHRLAEGIRKARRHAKRGALFTPGTEAAIRKVMRPLIAGPEGPSILKTVHEDLPKSFKLKINAEYPETQPFTSVPISVLSALPQLPTDVQYRFIPRHMLLFDARANLILDYLEIY